LFPLQTDSALQMLLGCNHSEIKIVIMARYNKVVFETYEAIHKRRSGATITYILVPAAANRQDAAIMAATK